MRLKSFHPPHIYLDNTIYFITARTKDRSPYFDSEGKKSLLSEQLFVTAKKHGLKLIAWVVQDNHYHVLVHIKKKHDLVLFIKTLHGKSAIELNKLDGQLGRKIWVNYWDHGIRNDPDFWKHFNYIHYNPVKHGYVKNMEDYKFSSYHEWIKKKGREWTESCFRLYPIVDFTIQDV
jgi:putative transposase